MMVCCSVIKHAKPLHTTEAVVGLEEISYNVSESDGAVELCAVVFMPADDCPVAFEFEVMLSADNLTAGTVFCNSVTSFTISLSIESPMDYVDFHTTLTFAPCQRRSCVNVSIVDDDVLELTESFSITLERTPGLDDRIELGPVDGEVQINDSDGMLICSSVLLLSTHY